jgi:predicted nucleic acid-binding protein
MKKVVVDTSVVVKWFVPEAHSAAAARLLDLNLDLSAPDLIGPEIENTLWKKIRRQEITREEASDILGAFETIGLQIYPSAALLSSALQLAMELDRSVYDSLFLALAIARNCSLITADRKFHSVVIASALAPHIRWVEDEP